MYEHQWEWLFSIVIPSPQVAVMIGFWDGLFHSTNQAPLCQGNRPTTLSQTKALNSLLITEGIMSIYLQELEMRLCAEESSAWSNNLVEYTDNFLPSSATRLSPFQAAYSYQHPLFSSQEVKASAPSELALVKHCRQVWRISCATLLWLSRNYAHWANLKHHPAPPYHIGQRVWLSTRDLALKIICQKMEAMAVHLRIPRALRVHLTFHICRLKPAIDLLLCYLKQRYSMFFFKPGTLLE